MKARGVSVLALLLWAPSQAQELQRVGRAARGDDGALPLLDRRGARVGVIAVEGETLHLRPRGASEVVAPRLQQWIGTRDGRTLVGVGDERALEHPFELRLVVYRDGQRVAEPRERFATDSELAVGLDGRVALVGFASGERERPLALVIEPDGALQRRYPLPPGTLAHDPELFGPRLLVRVHAAGREGEDGALLSVGADGVHTLAEVPGAVALAGFPELQTALVLTRDTAQLFDARDGSLRWERALALRPAHAHAFAPWRTGEGELLALITAGLPLAGEPGPELVLVDARDGAVRARQALAAVDSPADFALATRGRDLVLERPASEEVFTWAR